MRLIASYRDFVNKDGATERDVRQSLEELERNGVLEVKGQRWRLLREFP